MNIKALLTEPLVQGRVGHGHFLSRCPLIVGDDDNRTVKRPLASSISFAIDSHARSRGGCEQ